MLILANVALITITSTVEDKQYEHVYKGFEWFSVVVFSLEYLLRLWSSTEDVRYASPCHGRLRWAMSPLNVLDLVALLPFVIDLALPDDDDTYRGATALRAVRLLRLFSLLRLERAFGAFARVHAVLSDKGEELLVTIFVAGILLVVSSSLMYYIENPVNEAFSDMPTAMWWATTYACVSTPGLASAITVEYAHTRGRTGA